MEPITFASLLGGPALSVLLVWFMRTWIGERLRTAIAHEYAQKLETSKAELKVKNDLELEKLRADLRVLATEREIAFGALHAERASTIVETYKLLSRFYRALEAYVDPLQPVGAPARSELREEAGAAQEAFLEQFYDRRILLPKATADALRRIDVEMNEAGITFRSGIEGNESEATGEWARIRSKMALIRSLVEMLEADFRALLGDRTVSGPSPDGLVQPGALS